MLATTPSGSCEMRSSIEPATSTDTFFGRSVRAVSAMKKSRRGARPFSSLRDWAMGLPTSVVRTRASASDCAATRSRNFSIAAKRFLSATRAQPGCAARACWYFALTLFASSALRSAATSPVAGFTTFSFMRYPGSRLRESCSSGFHRHHRCRLSGPLATLAGGEEGLEQRAAVDERGIVRVHELGMPLHADHEAVPLPADRLDEAVGLAHRLGHEALADLLDGLVVDGIDALRLHLRIDAREPRVGQDAHLVESVVVL